MSREVVDNRQVFLVVALKYVGSNILPLKEINILLLEL